MGADNTSATRLTRAGFGVALALISTASTADARGRHRFVPHHVVHRFARGAVASGGGANYAALVVDANTGHTLYAVNDEALRHPASITKVMTLYLLFEKLDRGDMSLSTPLTVSRHAASQSPTKLGLRPGATISVENAIKAIVTRSANDMAVAVAEAVGGDEDSFARLMTRKAHALGMARTTYVNASGLPDNRQITTARDLSILGRAIQDHFPTYYRYFSTTSFTYAGQVIGTHNHLMSRVEGMDGIKTGYTNASGFNLLSNVRRDGHHIVAVVMGGKSAAGRDRIMEGLIAGHLEEAAPTRTAAVIEDRSPIEAPAETVAVTEQNEAADEPHDSSPSLIAPTMAVPPAPHTTHQAAIPPVRPASIEKARPAFVAGAPRPDPHVTGVISGRSIAADGSTNGHSASSATNTLAIASATPSSLRWVMGPQPAARPQAGDHAPTPVRLAAADMLEPTASIRSSAPANRATRTADRDAEPQALGGGTWAIQIGATDSAAGASELLNRARSQSRTALVSARPLTEKIQKGNATLYRARFAGLGSEQAEAACKTLKRSGFSCFTTHD